MPTIKCPIEGFEDVELVYPDVFTLRDNDKFWRAYNKVAGEDNSLIKTGNAFGCHAICEVKSEQLNGDLWEWPIPVVDWMINEVWHDGLKKALDQTRDYIEPAMNMPPEEMEQ